MSCVNKERFYFIIRSFFIVFLEKGGLKIMGTMKENYELMFTSYPDLVNIKELTKMLGIGITLAYRLVKNKTIPALKVGRSYKIPKRNIISYLTSQN